LTTEYISGISIENWLTLLRQRVESSEPDLIDIFETYAAEAKFGRAFINDDLKELPRGSLLLEVGAGAMILSCQLIREGFSVSALEPTGTGFSHFERLRCLVLECASTLNCKPSYIQTAAEDLDSKSIFDFAFSVNVMEHVNDVGNVLERVGTSLKLGAKYRFTCPNYYFPYEPHFNIPTLFSKKLTEKFFNRRIFESSDVLDPVGVWDSLNWINVTQIKKFQKRTEGFEVQFNRSFLVSIIERIGTDREFALRRSPLMRGFLLWIVKLHLHKIAVLIPVITQPVIDCAITRISIEEVS
jgi:SAM-dependent methyltransferase